jgi:Cd2+/Zn2+-exporting ATPase
MNEPLQFRIYGMDCADEVAILRRAIGPVVGNPERLAFDLLRAKMTVAAGSPEIDATTITKTVAATGMRAEVWQDTPPGAVQTRLWQRRRRTVLTTLSGLLSITAFVIHASNDGWIAALGSEGAGLAEAAPPLSIALYIAGIVTGGWFIVPRAWAALRRLRPDMNLLMTVAVIGASGIGEWFEAAVVTFLFACPSPSNHGASTGRVAPSRRS